MSDMLKRYEESKKTQVEKSHQIPDLAVNFFDQQNEFQDGFIPLEKKGDPTKFTTKAQDYYNTEVKTILIPDGFQPVEQGISLHRYTPEKKYFDPGKGK